MRYYFLLLTLVFLGCKKEATDKPLSIDALVVNDEEVSENAKYAIGQTLKIRPYFSSGTPGLTVSWTLTPNTNQPFEEGQSLLVWRPSSAGKFQIDLTVKSQSGKEASKEYTFETIPADIRYNVWGNSKTDVELNESVNQSEYDEFGMGEGGYLIKHSEVSNGRKDNVQPGELIWYIFDGKLALIGAEIEVPIPDVQDMQARKDFYESVKSNRLSEYTYMGHANSFASPEYISQYQDRPELWLEAIQKGVLVLRDLYENDRTTVDISWAGGNTISLRYLAKQ